MAFAGQKGTIVRRQRVRKEEVLIKKPTFLPLYSNLCKAQLKVEMKYLDY